MWFLPVCGTCENLLRVHCFKFFTFTACCYEKVTHAHSSLTAPLRRNFSISSPHLKHVKSLSWKKKFSLWIFNGKISFASLQESLCEAHTSADLFHLEGEQQQGMLSVWQYRWMTACLAGLQTVCPPLTHFHSVLVCFSDHELSVSRRICYMDKGDGILISVRGKINSCSFSVHLLNGVESI